MVSKKQWKRINRIMREFDFDKVHKVMLTLNWRWREETHPPSLAALKQSARAMLENALEIYKPGDHVLTQQSGGFHVLITGRKKRQSINLSFEVSSWQEGDN